MALLLIFQKLMRLRVSEDGHKLSQTEINRRYSDRHHAIDQQMNELFANVNWARRREAEKDIIKWVNTYCIGLFLEDPPPEKGEQVLRQMWNALDTHNNYMILMGRGSGKSVYELCTTMAALSQGVQKYIVIVSNNTRASSSLLKDIWRMISTNGTAFQQDYPEVCGPYMLCNGSLRRRQLFRGQATELSKTSQEITLPRLFKEDGTEYPTSGSIVTCRGLNSGIRGLRSGTQRVTCVLLDDLQDKDIAHNPEQVQKLLDTIKKDIIPLAGKERLSIIQTATPICPEDLVEKIQEDKTWKTTLFPSIISYPKNCQLWEQYFRLYDAELQAEDVTHDRSLQFYQDNFAAMNEGSEVFNPKRFSPKDGHISMIQKLLELEHNIGKSAFQAEYQMKPIKQSFSLNISPSIVSSKMNQYHELEIPPEYRYVTFGIDLNVAYAITVVGIAWKTDTTGIVFYHNLFPCQIDQKLPDIAYNAAVCEKLEEVCNKLKALNVKPNAVAIDCGGRQWTAVTLFAKRYRELPCCAFAGRNATQFHNVMYSRTRLKDAMGRTVLCGDEAERTKANGGVKYCFFDADYCKEAIHRAFLGVVGDIGSLSLYNAPKDEHAEFAIQTTNERIKSIQHKADGRDYYVWQTREPHDYLDCCAMARAALSQLGVTSNAYVPKKTQIARKPHRKVPKFRII